MFWQYLLSRVSKFLVEFLYFADYLLSNNHVNSIIVHKFDFSDEEVMAYYISFLKTLSLKLNPHTIHFFYNEVWFFFIFDFSKDLRIISNLVSRLIFSDSAWFFLISYSEKKKEHRLWILEDWCLLQLAIWLFGKLNWNKIIVRLFRYIWFKF